jgi:hypothetical protein
VLAVVGLGAHSQKDSAVSPEVSIAMAPAEIALAAPRELEDRLEGQQFQERKKRCRRWLRNEKQLAGGQACQTSSKKGSFPLCAYFSETSSC